MNANTFIFLAKALIRIAIFGVAYLVAKILSPENAIWWAFGAYFLYAAVGWAVVFLYRGTLRTLADIELGDETPRFGTPEAIANAVANVVRNIESGVDGYGHRSPKFPIEFDRSMDDVLDSISRLDSGARRTFFSALAEIASRESSAHTHFPAFSCVIMRLASRAVREREAAHLVRGIYAAQSALLAGADYRDILVSYSTIWDAANRLRVYLRSVAQEIAADTPDLSGILTVRTAGIKSMALVAKEDEFGFRYDYDESWSP